MHPVARVIKPQDKTLVRNSQPFMKAETCRDHREHEIKHILLIVANEGLSCGLVMCTRLQAKE
jgi:hypothetical protein